VKVPQQIQSQASYAHYEGHLNDISVSAIFLVFDEGLTLINISAHLYQDKKTYKLKLLQKITILDQKYSKIIGVHTIETFFDVSMLFLK